MSVLTSRSPAQTPSLPASGPEQQTFVEKIAGLTRLPYPVSCIIMGSLLGPPSFFLLFFLDSLDPGKTVTEISSSTFFTIGQFGQPLPFAQGLAVAVLFNLFMILTLYFARYMRTISLNVEANITRLCPEFTEQDYHKTFGGIHNIKFVLLLTAAFTILYVPSRLAGSTGPFSFFSAVVLLPLDFLVISGTLWVYLRSLWGIYKFGKRDLTLLPYHKDRMLGLHPIGAMSLSFGIVYLALDTTALAAGVLTTDIENLIVLVGLLVLLATMLFLPVYGIHKKMMAEKTREKADLRSRIANIVSKTDEKNPETPNKELTNLNYLLAYRTLNGEVSRMPTWPFETGRLERFLAIFLSVTSILIARLVQLAFHF